MRKHVPGLRRKAELVVAAEQGELEVELENVLNADDVGDILGVALAPYTNAGGWAALVVWREPDVIEDVPFYPEPRNEHGTERPDSGARAQNRRVNSR